MNYVRPSIPDDISYLKCRLRKPDQRELDLFGISAETALSDGLAHSLQPLTVISDGSPIAMFGVVPGNGQGTVWLLGSNRISDIKVPFLRQSVVWLDHVTKPFSVVGNWVDSRNSMHRKWLSWLGFEIEQTVEVKGIDVHYYRKNK